MLGRLTASVLITMVTALTACAGTSVTPLPTEDRLEFSVRHLPPSPSPLGLEVHAGRVEALIPGDWEAEPLPQARYPQEGFVASPQLADWDRAAGTVRGMEAFWVDVGRLRIPSDYYYLVARGPAMSSLASNGSCRPTSQEVLADHPPELAGQDFSPGDYIVSAMGTCRGQGRTSPTQWAYIVAAPGFGPVRDVGLPTSGLYVVMAVVSGKKAGRLLRQIIEGARFGDVPISTIVAAARTTA